MTATHPSISIVVPTLNEAENVIPLIARIDTALAGKAVYEIIFIDDNSTDETVAVIRSLAAGTRGGQRQIVVHSKIGKPGKAFSLVEGFESANLDLICMIDADLQYPPEAIPEMLAAIEGGFDIIVANRVLSDAGLVRRQLSRLGRQVYGKWLYGFDCDVQSGLKLFRKSILDHLTFDTTPWTFDISFLVQSRERGHKIGTVSIPFAERHSGISKVNIFGTGFEILIEAVKFKLHKNRSIAKTELSNAND